MYLEDRSARILESLMDNEQMTVDELAKSLSLSKRSIYYSIEDIGSWLELNGLEALASIRGKGYFITDKKSVEAKLRGVKVMPDFNVEERQSLIFCALLMGNQAIFVEDLIDLTLVSRNTIFNDFKDIKESFSRYNLDLIFDQKTGYRVEGSEIQKRSLFLYRLYYLNDLIYNAGVPSHLKYNFLNRSQISYVLSKLRRIEEKLGVEYVEGTLLPLATLINVVMHGRQEIESNLVTEDELEKHKEYLLLEKEFKTLKKRELEYFSMHLLGTRIQIINQKQNPKEAYDLALAMVDKFEELAAVTFNKKSLLLKQISTHLSMSSYRYRYGIHHANPMLDEIKEKYYNEFIITNKVFDIVRNKLKSPVSEGEVAYVTLYFASYLVRKELYNDKVKFSIVCPSGVSTSIMLKSELEYLDSMIEVVKVMSVNEFRQNGIDPNSILLSTVHLNTPIDYVKVNPVLNQNDREKVLNLLPHSAKTVQGPKIADILEIVKPYVSNNDLSFIKKDLDRYFKIHTNKTQNIEKKIVDVLSKDSVVTAKSVETWQDALYLAAQPLIETNSIEKSYVEEIIKATNRYGAYMVIEGGFMIAHASYEIGVNDLGLSFLKLEKPVKIKDTFINKIFVLSAVDQKKHLGIMRELFKVFTDSNLQKNLEKYNTVKELYITLLEFLIAE